MRLLVALAMLLVPATLSARAQREMVEIRAGEPVTIRADRAYILFRTVRPQNVLSYEPIFMRIPRADEMERYAEARRRAYREAEPAMIRRREEQLQQNREIAASGRASRRPVDRPPSLEAFNFAYWEILNVQNIDARRALVRGRPESVYLVEVVPGDYVLYGATVEAGGPVFAVCMCLGTVGWSAPAGVVTDLGFFLPDNVHRVSVIPEVRVESGFGPTMSYPLPMIGATVRPAQSATPLPEALRGASVRAADYRAVGRFVEPRAAAINRLVAVPGVLAYDAEGRVVDVRSGRVAPDIR